MLPVLEPPIGFTQRVMAHVHELERAPRLWERLFFPLRVKIPLQAVAAALMVVFAVYLFQKEEPTLTPPRLAATQRTIASAIKPDGPVSFAAKSQTRSEEMSTDKTTNSPARSVNQPIASNKTEAVHEQRVQTPVQSPSVNEPAKSRGTIPAISVSNTGAGSVSESEWASRRGTTIIEPFANYEIVFRPRARRENLALIKNDEANRSSAQSSGRTAIEQLLDSMTNDRAAQTVWLSIAKKDYEQWKQDLGAAGAIESESSVPLFHKDTGSEGTGQLQIKLTVLPQAEPSRAAQPSQPPSSQRTE